MEERIYQSCLTALKEELLPAMGCTEPIAVAYAAAILKQVLGGEPEKAEVCVSGNILKNVKSVVVPGTGGMKGIVSAVAAGIIAGDPKKRLEVISSLTEADISAVKQYISRSQIKVKQSDSGCIFDILIRGEGFGHIAAVRIVGHHTNVALVQKDGKDIVNNLTEREVTAPEGADRSLLTVENVLQFAESVKIEDIDELLTRQIEYNMAIAKEGLTNNYGARVGKVLLNSFGKGVHNRAKAYAAAGSDARMNGCNLPVVIVSGSGNQGITASVPVVIFAEHLNCGREKLLRALVISNLITVHLKTGIGRLSAYCGAVSAGCGAAAGVAYLYGCGPQKISSAIVNAPAIDSGLICDGAKSSCAAKIASAVEAGLVGMEMSRSGSAFCCGDGILGECVENTIDNVSDVARNGMRATDEEIIRLMIKNAGN